MNMFTNADLHMPSLICVCWENFSALIILIHNPLNPNKRKQEDWCLNENFFKLEMGNKALFPLVKYNSYLCPRHQTLPFNNTDYHVPFHF